MKRIAIDSNVVDVIADTSGLLDAVVEAGKTGRLVVIGNHVLRDELERTTNPERRARLIAVYEALPLREVATSGLILDKSRLDKAGLGDGSESGVSLGEVATKGRGKLSDALMATTASGYADALVTCDSTLRARVLRSSAKCEVWTQDEFKGFVLAR